jgi:hypothetical protein
MRGGWNKIAVRAFVDRGRHPPFKTAPVADSQRSLTRSLEQAHARIAKGDGLHSASSSKDRPIRSIEVGTVNFETPESPLQPSIGERAIDTAADVSRTMTEVSGALRAAVDRLSDAIAASREPGGALSTVSAITREAPLASLLVAFLFGVAVARRH